MSDRITIRDAVITRINSEQSSYNPKFFRSHIDNLSKGDTSIVVILTDEVIEDALMDGVKYRVRTFFDVSVAVIGSGESAENADTQSDVETVLENIYNALMEWNTLSTDMAVEQPEIHYEGISNYGFYANKSDFGADISFSVEYDKN